MHMYEFFFSNLKNKWVPNAEITLLRFNHHRFILASEGEQFLSCSASHRKNRLNWGEMEKRKQQWQHWKQETEEDDKDEKEEMLQTYFWSESVSSFTAI